MERDSPFPASYDWEYVRGDYQGWAMKLAASSISSKSAHQTANAPKAAKMIRLVSAPGIGTRLVSKFGIAILPSSFATLQFASESGTPFGLRLRQHQNVGPVPGCKKRLIEDTCLSPRLAHPRLQGRTTGAGYAAGRWPALPIPLPLV